jgi:predicted nucleic acid-binding protein
LPDVLCNTSPLQYLHQLALLHLLPALAETVMIPPAVVAELAAGRELGVDVPDPAMLPWITVREPIAAPALPLVNDLGPGETQVLMLGLEVPGAILVLDDALARRVAFSLQLPLIGTLGLLLAAKRANLIPAVAPLLDHLDALRFRLSGATRGAVLRLADEDQD